MAAITIGVRRSESVVVVDVAVGAGVDFARRRQLVRAKQRPACRSVVERRRQKRHGIVAVRTIRRREGRSRRRVHRVGGPLPAAAIVRVQVTLRVPAIGRLDRQIVIVVDVAVAAGGDLARRGHLMRIRQREAGRGVIKGRILPGNGVMAVGATGDRKHRGRCRVLRVGRLLPGREMASGVSAVRRSNLQIVVAADMTARARDIGVPIGQRKIDRWGGVVDGHSEPTVEGMAGVASLRELRRNVVGYVPAHRLGSLVILQVTRDTSRR